MNTSKKYYLNEGKLELSILEDYEDEKGQIIQLRSRRNITNQLGLNTTKRQHKKECGLVPPKLKVSKEVYNTLHTMGQFLTQTEEMHEKTEDGLNSLSAQQEKVPITLTEDEISALNGILKLDIEVAQDLSQEEDISIDVYTYMDSTQKVENILSDAPDSMQRQEVTSPNEEISVHHPKLEEEKLEEDKVLKQNSEDYRLKQKEVDHIVEGYFKDQSFGTPKHTYLVELKKHIEKQIKAIYEYALES